jgi:hypothetical protein
MQFLIFVCVLQVLQDNSFLHASCDLVRERSLPAAGLQSFLSAKMTDLLVRLVKGVIPSGSGGMRRRLEMAQIGYSDHLPQLPLPYLFRTMMPAENAAQQAYALSSASAAASILFTAWV